MVASSQRPSSPFLAAVEMRNPHLPELAGDHHGLDGLGRFFEQLGQTSDTGFHNEPHSLTRTER